MSGPTSVGPNILINLFFLVITWLNFDMLVSKQHGISPVCFHLAAGMVVGEWVHLTLALHGPSYLNVST